MIEIYQDSKGNIHKLTTDVEQIILEDMNSLTKTLADKYKEIERLTELCNKYEEEHKTTFETWQKDIKEIERLKIQVSARETEYERLHSIIKEVRDYITTIKDEDIQYTIGWVKQDILQILDKVGEE